MHTFADPLKRAVVIAPNQTAIISDERSLTYRELHDRVLRLGSYLDRAGIGPGERVAVLSNNSHAYIEAYLGVPASGRVVVPLNTRHAEPELDYALRDAGTKLLLTDRDPRGLGDAVDHVLDLGADYERALAESDPSLSPYGRGIDENTLAGLFYTGGTTGASKGVMLSHRNLLANAFHWMSLVPQRMEDRYLIMAPLFHAAGSNGVLASVWTAGTMITLGSFSPEAALDLVQKHGITQTLGVPAMVAAMTELQLTEPRDVSSFQVFAHGGSPIATEVVRRCARAFPGVNLVELYGATETSPLAVALPHEETLLEDERLRATGRPIVGVEITIQGPDGPLPAGEVGEVVIRGNNVMQGYWNKPEQTAAVLNGREYKSGDLGYMDAEGYVYLVDRSKDMIVTGGENVYSIEVEEALYRNEAVLEAAVFGVPDEKWGEAVWAAVVLREGFGEDQVPAIIEFCKARIAGYKVPKGIDIRTEPLPKSGPGKVLKRELRAPYWEGRKRSVN